jgi:EAL domain-containing protein (putative c-di-GMP-specific phosphodiesterase class I)
VSEVASGLHFETSIAGSARSFLAEAGGNWPVVLFLDLQMPDIDGIALLRELGSAGCTSKIVLASGMDARVLNAAARVGTSAGLQIAATLEKPARAAAVREILNKLRSDQVDLTADELSRAIDNDQLFLEYQPIVYTQTRRMVGVEALVRWRHVSGRTIPPVEFIALAEASGLIDRLTGWVIETAFRQVAKWWSCGMSLHMSINLSALNIRDREFPDRIAALCEQTGVAPDWITFELTETASTRDPETLVEVLGRIRVKGFHLSIDDFGTGYSSVAQLLRLPFSEMKIDRSFIAEVHRQQESEIVSRTLVGMARDLGLKAVAEGVDSKEALQRLREWECPLAQGFLFSRPVSAAAIEAMGQEML